MRKITTSYLIAAFLVHNTWLSKLIPDEVYLRIIYKGYMNKPLDLENPNTFNEKLQWLKLHDRKSEYTTMVDKYLAKEYVAARIGKKYIIPTYGVWDSFDAIEFETLPNQFVLKCSHDSGGLVICKDKANFDFKSAKKKIEASLKSDFYYVAREWPYKNVKSRIIAEKYMEDSATHELRDYKFFCFNGVAKFFKIDFDRQIKHRANYYDLEGKLLPFGEVICPPDEQRKLTMPSKLKDMVKFAELLSRGYPFMRVDFYEANGDLYWGEITLFPSAGLGKFNPEEWDLTLGNMICLSFEEK